MDLQLLLKIYLAAMNEKLILYAKTLLVWYISSLVISAVIALNLNVLLWAEVTFRTYFFTVFFIGGFALYMYLKKTAIPWVYAYLKEIDAGKHKWAAADAASKKHETALSEELLMRVADRL